MSTFYQKHFFFCNNQKNDGKKCCNAGGGTKMAAFARTLLQESGNWGPKKCRVSTSGCQGRCGLGPILVVYPEACWYKYENEQDVKSIIEHHLLHNHALEQYQLP